MVGLALTQQALRRPAAAGETIDGLLSLAEESQAPILLSVARSGQARLALAQGKIEPAVRWLRSFDQRSSGSDLLCWLEQPTITSARVLIAIGSDESLRDATELLEKLRLVTQELHNTCQTIDILALQSLALEKWAHPDEALAVLEQALTLAQPGGWIRPFVEPGPVMAELLERLSKGSGHDMYLDRILAAFGDAGHTPVGAEAETVGPSRPGLREQGVVPRAPFADLTKRELEVLELLAQRLQNKEIAQRLFISTQTVITHLKHIYRKLKVGNRRQAVIRAVETGILGRQSSG